MNQKEQARKLGIVVTEMSGKYYARKDEDGFFIAVERSEELALARAIARVQSGLFWRMGAAEKSLQTGIQ
jgi:hypothetical protein